VITRVACPIQDGTEQCITAAKKANQTLGRMARAFSYRDKKI